MSFNPFTNVMSNEEVGLPGGGAALSGDIAKTYVTSSTGATHAISSNVANTYVTSSVGATHAVSGNVADTYTTSSYVAGAYVTSSVGATHAISSNVANVYVISSTFAKLGSVRVVGGTKSIVFASGAAGISSEITHNISAQVPTTVVATIEASSWIGSIIVHNITQSSFWIRTSEPPVAAASSETISANVHWIALLTSW